MVRNATRDSPQAGFGPPQGAPRAEASRPSAIDDASVVSEARYPIEILISPGRALRWLLLVITALLLAMTLGVIAWLGFGHSSIWGLRPLLDVGREANIPTYFSSVQLLAAALLLGVIARHQALIGSRWRWHFLVLAVGFLVLSVDEMASIHETLLRRMGTAVLGDVFYFPWLGPGIALVVLVALAYVPFLLALPRRFRLLFVASGAIFIGGAIGAEAIGSELARHHLNDRAIWDRQFQILVEEGLEMTGVALFIYSLLAYLAEARIEVLMRFRSSAGP